MAAVQSAPSQTLFDGRNGERAPFKADYVSSLVTSVLNAEIDQILRMKAFQDPKPSTEKTDIFDQLVEALKKEQDDPNHKFPLKEFGGKKEDPSTVKIGIVGGGIAGLYAAYILKSLDIDYEILEANPDRIGGRVYTHHFSENAHDYYDIGAMRFPDSPIMARTFDLFKRLGMGEPGQPAKDNDVLIPYYMTGKNCPTRYNDITAVLGPNEQERKLGTDRRWEPKQPDVAVKSEADPFMVSTANGGTVPATRVSQKVTADILNDAYDRFRRKIKAAQELTEEATRAAKNGDHSKTAAAADARQYAYEYLMRHDKFSLRDYLQNVEGYDPETVHWLETTSSASGWFDMAFTENVFESLAFDYCDASNKKEKEKPVEWWCINGGTAVTIDRLLEKLGQGRLVQGRFVQESIANDKKTIFPGKVVTKMALRKISEDEKPKQHNIAVTMIDYHTHAEEKRTYSAVINTTTLGALQKIDLTRMEIPYGMKTAIRVLRYDTSTKVGIKFKKMWWKEEGFNITLGGVARTDLPIRVCVYPSYNIHDSGPGVLLASYTWGQDSERVAAHVSTTPPSTGDKDQSNVDTRDKGLKQLMIYNLARLHTIKDPKESEEAHEARFEKNKEIIRENWITHHAWDWSKDEFSSGAFALFSPGQFSTLIPHLIRPASDGRFVIVGEHASANHAWIVGALDSSLRGLKQILTRFNMDKKLEDMIRIFGDVDELKQEQVAKQVIISMLKEEEMAQLRIGRPVQAPAGVQQT